MNVCAPVLLYVEYSQFSGSAVECKMCVELAWGFHEKTWRKEIEYHRTFMHQWGTQLIWL